ncbi:hypothetical protein KAU34_05160, partial [candidate division WOR-3 bacterium]|nr:hypothetical protein [candidate division WOR-3 bacterium]
SFGIGPQEFYLVKTDADGDTNWTGTYGKGDIDCGNSVCETSDNGYIIAGYTDGTNGGDVYVVKTNAVGDTMWTKTYGGTSVDEGYSVQETYDGGYIIAGNTMSFGPSLFNVYLIKIDADGDTMWTGAYGGGFLRYCYSVLQTSDSSGYITAGILQRIGECPNACLTKIDTNGVVLWTKEYGGTEYDWSYSVQQTSDNGYIVTGFTESYGAGGYDVYLIKTDSIGDTMWTKTYGGAGDEEGLSVIETSDGGYLIAGYTDSFGAGYNDVYLIKTDADGDTIWTKTIGGTGSEKAYSVQEISEDEYIIAGSTSSYGAGFSDVYLIRMGRDRLPPDVQVSYPNGGEIFQPGDTCDIAWIATDN